MAGRGGWGESVCEGTNWQAPLRRFKGGGCAQRLPTFLSVASFRWSRPDMREEEEGTPQNVNRGLLSLHTRWTSLFDSKLGLPPLGHQRGAATQASRCLPLFVRFESRESARTEDHPGNRAPPKAQPAGRTRRQGARRPPVRARPPAAPTHPCRQLRCALINRPRPARPALPPRLPLRPYYLSSFPLSSHPPCASPSR